MPDLAEHLVQLTSLPEQRHRKTEGPKVTEWTIPDRPPNAPTVTLGCHQHTWWVAQWNATGTTDRVDTFTPEARTATPLALGDRFSHLTHHTDHPLAHWLAPKTAMHWTVDAPTTDTTLPATWLNLIRKLAAYVRKHGASQAERWMSCPRTRKKLSNIAPPTCKTLQKNFEVCTNPVRAKGWQTASARTSTTATRRSQPPSWSQHKPDPSHGLVLRGRASRPARSNDPSRH